MSVEVQAQGAITSPDVAREVTATLRNALVRYADATADALMALKRAWDGRVWEPLGYESWDAYAAEELSEFRKKQTRGEREQFLAALAAATSVNAAVPALPSPALAAVLGVSPQTVNATKRALGAQAAAQLTAQRAKRDIPAAEKARLKLVQEARLKAAAEGTRLRQQELAHYTGTSQPTINRDIQLLDRHPEVIEGIDLDEARQVMARVAPSAPVARGEDVPLFGGAGGFDDDGDAPGAGRVIDHDDAGRAYVYGVDQTAGVSASGVSAATSLLRRAKDAATRLGPAVAVIREVVESAVWEQDPLVRGDLAAITGAELASALHDAAWIATHLGLNVPGVLAADDRTVERGAWPWVNDPRPLVEVSRAAWTWRGTPATPRLVAEQAIEKGRVVDPDDVTAVVKLMESLPADRCAPQVGVIVGADLPPPSFDRRGQ